ncbi:MAG: efflux RND transporter periplasmic adaptor subunit, partial [Gammaproteobacteria bacterium]|nr:efflux RND transporter periplasmic adaptor subunit [Gammaproteobacteria bacterium]
MMINNPFKKHQSLVYALSIFLLLSAWLASGYLGSKEKKTAPQSTSLNRTLIQKVRVRVPETTRVVQEIVLNGRTEASRAVTLRTEVDGRVVQVAATKGNVVGKGELILQLDKRDRQARLAEAHALLKQRELEYSGVKKLQKDNLQSEIELARIAAQLATSKALAERIELEISNTRITAPFDGILDRLPVEVGSYLKAGDEVGHLLEQDPIIFVGYVSQQERHRLVLGDRGIARLVTGAVVE